MHREIIRSIGRLETGISEAHRRVDSLTSEVRWNIVRLERRMDKRNGNGRKFPWVQIAAMGTVALTSLLGLISPEKAAAILRALIH